jgi:hypothetical protein
MRYVALIVLLTGVTCAQTVPPNLFGIHWFVNASGKQPAPPAVPFGAARLWGSSPNSPRWSTLNTAAGVYNFAALDNALSVDRANGLTHLLMVMGTTPAFISSDPTNANCQGSSGSCGVPADIAASCTNVNELNNCDGKTDGTNQTWRNFIYALAQHISTLGFRPAEFEVWNEFTDKNPSGIFTSWEGTNAQLLRMAQDAYCILKGKVSATCSAALMHVPAVGLLPSATVLTPDSLLAQTPDANAYFAYIQQPGALAVADVVSVHTYTAGPAPTSAEKVSTMVQALEAALAKVGQSCKSMPCWSTEGSWGQNANMLPDPDLEAAFTARYYLVGWSSGLQRMYEYAYNAIDVGTLWVNGLTPAGSAYSMIYGWMVGSQMPPCTVSGTVWTCNLTLKNGSPAMILWDTSQTCSQGTCGTLPQPVPKGFVTYETLSGVTSVTGVAVPVGAKPVLLTGIASVTNLIGTVQ